MKEMEACIYCEYFRALEVLKNGTVRGACGRLPRKTDGDEWCRYFREKTAEVTKHDAAR